MPENKKKQILLIEDDKFLRKVYSVKLEKEGYDLLIAKNGEEALTLLFHNKPDLILLDLILPKITGFDLLTTLKTSDDYKKDIKVIILSNLGQKSDIDKAKSLGAIDYIVKSNTSMVDVVATIKKYI